MATTQQVTFQLRRGNTTGTTGWVQQNPTLAAGEPGFELDTGKLKIGTGTVAWNSLPYVSGSGGSTVSVPVNSMLWSASGTSITGTTGLQYSSTRGITMESLQIRSNTQQVAIGNQAGKTNQGVDTVALGYLAGSTDQQLSATAVGTNAGSISQSEGAVALGFRAGIQNQGLRAVSVGTSAGAINQGEYSIGIGYKAGAGVLSTQAANTIILNASGGEVNGVAGQTGSFYVTPIRQDITKTIPLFYDPTTKEIVQGLSNLGGGSIGVTGGTGIAVTLAGTTFVVTSNVLDSNNNVTVGTGSLSSAPNTSVSVGYQAGQINQRLSTVAVGYQAAQSNQDTYAVAIGYQAGQTGQGGSSVAIGQSSGKTSQSASAIAIGRYAGNTGQGTGAIAIGNEAAMLGQGNFAIAIGTRASGISAIIQPANTIILNASGAVTSGISGQTGSFYVTPIRNSVGTNSLQYNPGTKEITYGPLGGGSVVGVTGSTGIGVTFDGTTYTVGFSYAQGDSVFIGARPQVPTAVLPGRVGIGSMAGARNQSTNSIAIGASAGTNLQGGTTGGAIAIGYRAGESRQGDSSIAIGLLAGAYQQPDNSIILNATGTEKNGEVIQNTPGHSFACYILPVRTDVTQTIPLYYNPTSGEVVQGAPGSGGGPAPGVTGSTGIGVIFDGTNYTVGFSYAQGDPVYLGNAAGSQTTSGAAVIGLGDSAGDLNQGRRSIAIGYYAGSSNQGGSVGSSIAIGDNAGANQQGAFSIAIGAEAGSTGQLDNSIILNASGYAVNGGATSAFYVTPVRSDVSQTIPLMYNPVTYEIVQGATSSAASALGVSGSTGIGVIFNGTTYTVGFSYGDKDAIALGFQAGLQSMSSTVSIGAYTNQNLTQNLTQTGFSVSIGHRTGQDYQASQTVAIGSQAGQTYQGTNSVAIGYQAGKVLQGGTTGGAIAIGSQAGETSQGVNAIAIGALAGYTGQPDYSIILDTSGLGTVGTGGVPNSCFINPIRQDTTQTIPLMYNRATYEVVTGMDPIFSSGVTMCGTQFLVDADAFPGDNGINVPVKTPPTGYAYVDIQIPLVTDTSNVQVCPILRGFTGINNGNDWGRLIGVECLLNGIRVWTQQPGGSLYGFPVGSTYAGFSWDVITF